jgi:hypothetical protein
MIGHIAQLLVCSDTFKGALDQTFQWQFTNVLNSTRIQCYAMRRQSRESQGIFSVLVTKEFTTSTRSLISHEALRYRWWSSGDYHNPKCVLSHTGYVITMYAGCSITWSSKLQTEIEIDLGTTEAEYIALSQSMRQTLPFMNLICKKSVMSSSFSIQSRNFTAKFLRTTWAASR